MAKFPIRTELVQTSMEGVYIRPDYEPIKKGSNADLALDILRNGFCDADAKRLDVPDRVGFVQAKQVIDAFYGAVDDMGKPG